MKRLMVSAGVAGALSALTMLPAHALEAQGIARDGTIQLAQASSSSSSRNDAATGTSRSDPTMKRSERRSRDDASMSNESSTSRGSSSGSSYGSGAGMTSGSDPTKRPPVSGRPGDRTTGSGSMDSGSTGTDRSGSGSSTR